MAIVVATSDHRRCFERHLADSGVDVAAARARGVYLAPDASETMRGFMVADYPDPGRFWQAISPVLRQSVKAGQQPAPDRRFFDGLDLVAPGVVSCSRWRPEPSPGAGQPDEVDESCGVARKRPAAKTRPPA